MVIDASEGCFELEMSLRLDKTREKALIARTMVLKQLVIAVNKMDDPSVNYQQARFDEIKLKVTA